ncbi:MAG TPA: HAMP domain-containing sensor histidine kinase [Gemmatimonadaceae bacterium]|nr:HAMP domain-containing sensor histidine kinase [Gemmatimonadaceae bacterium]
MSRLTFRARLLLILALFAAVPAVALTAGWVLAFNTVAPLMSGRAQWDRVASTGSAAIAAARSQHLTPQQEAAVNNHEREISESLNSAHRVAFLSRRVALVLVAIAALALAVLAWPTWRVAGHLTRQLSRPLDELVGWTDLVARGEPIPPGPAAQGAPEFGVLQERMRSMAEQLEAGRQKAIEAERLRAYRESSRQFAHELKNPLTPIRFAISRLKRDAPVELNDTIDVLETESSRLESMAKSFSQFGRLPEGPTADIDVGELVSYAARAAVPERFAVTVSCDRVFTVRGQHDALFRALSNILLNAVDACGADGKIDVAVTPAQLGEKLAVRIAVRDSGPGIPPERITSIWDPYVTHKTGGTGLGLAIARQSVEAHGGEVFAKSDPGDTEIGFVLPLKPATST